MKFKMNNRNWEIIELSQQELKEKDGCINEEGFIFGLTMYDKQIIYLWKDVAYEKKRETLMHELMHCYLDCYVSFQNMRFDEEVLAHICANSHDIIHDIVERYFKKEV